MDERMKESMSALMDDEANELEMQRVLSNMDEPMCQTWHRYHQVRQVVRECGPELGSIDVRAALASRLDGEELGSTAIQEPGTVVIKPGSKNRSGRIAALSAIAATAVLAMFFTTQSVQWGSPSIESPLVTQGPSSDPNGLSAEAEQTGRQPKVHVVFDEEHARRFNEYLLRHAGHSASASSQGVMPLARVASVNSVGI